jgi:hypothetical protein
LPLPAPRFSPPGIRESAFIMFDQLDNDSTLGHRRLASAHLGSPRLCDASLSAYGLTHVGSPWLASASLGSRRLTSLRRFRGYAAAFIGLCSSHSHRKRAATCARRNRIKDFVAEATGVSRLERGKSRRERASNRQEPSRTVKNCHRTVRNGVRFPIPCDAQNGASSLSSIQQGEIRTAAVSGLHTLAIGERSA